MPLSGILTQSHIIGEFQFSLPCAPAIVMGCFLLLMNGVTNHCSCDCNI